MIARVLVARRGMPIALPLDYLVPDGLALAPGDPVIVPFGPTRARGVVWDLAERSDLAPERLRAVLAREPGPAVPRALLGLYEWLRADCLCRYGEAASPFLPPSPAADRPGDLPLVWSGKPLPAQGPSRRVRQAVGERPVTRRDLVAAGASPAAIRRWVAGGWLVPAPPAPPAPFAAPAGPSLTAAQRSAQRQIEAALSDGQNVLLHGVTGSGKTEVYLSLLAPLVAAGAGALVLVPEIALTPQARRRYGQAFGPAAEVLHSGLSASQRRRAWRRLATGEARLAIGPRSAVWAPLERVRLAIVDEEPDPAYQSETAPRYDARRVAEERARRDGGIVVYGSATPSLEAYARARGEGVGARLRLVSLPERAHGRSLPPIEVVDLRRRPRAERRHVLSGPLLEALAETRAAGGQAVLLLNRRGLHPVVLCRDCGKSLRCPACAVSLTLHGDIGCLCHYCGRAQAVPATCPNCRGVRLGGFGAGTQRLAAEVAERLPGSKVLRLDRDTASRAGGAEAIVEAFARGEADILVGTQMVAKGHDFPRVTLVGVVAADQGLSFPDFRAAERTFALLTQAAGRAGRGEAAGRVVVQAFETDHPAIRHAARHDYLSFAEGELSVRKDLGYPPYAHLAAAVVAGREEAAALAAAEALAAGLSASGLLERVLGPAPSLVPRVDGWSRFQVLALAATPERLREAARPTADGRSGDARVDWVFDPARLS